MNILLPIHSDNLSSLVEEQLSKSCKTFIQFQYLLSIHWYYNNLEFDKSKVIFTLLYIFPDKDFRFTLLKWESNIHSSQCINQDIICNINRDRTWCKIKCILKITKYQIRCSSIRIKCPLKYQIIKIRAIKFLLIRRTFQ